MPKAGNEATVRVHVWLYTRDMEFIDSVWGPKGIKQSFVVREILHDYLERLRAKSNASAQAIKLSLDDVQEIEELAKAKMEDR